MKKCSICLKTKSLCSFTKHKGSKDGHVNQCKSCLAYKARLERKNNPDKFREVSRRSKKKNYNTEKQSAYKRRKYWEDPNTFRLRNKEQFKKHYCKRKHAYRLQTAKRRSNKLNATPTWLTKEHLQEIKNIYWLAVDITRTTGERYEVDHIIPLQGKNICGLHVPWNLQVLPAYINRSKGNKYCD